MSEPREVATTVEPVVEGIWHWGIRNSAIGGSPSTSHAVADGDGCVLVDPVRLEEEQLARLPRPTAIVLTARCHQRSAWRYRDELGADVWLPEDAEGSEQEPDRRYAEGDVLPGGLRALRTPGPERAHYSLLLERDPPVLFCSDLVMRADGGLAFVPAEHHEDPAETRRSVERLLDVPFEVLCLDHGAPFVDDPKTALRELLSATA